MKKKILLIGTNVFCLSSGKVTAYKNAYLTIDFGKNVKIISYVDDKVRENFQFNDVGAIDFEVGKNWRGYSVEELTKLDDGWCLSE